MAADVKELLLESSPAGLVLYRRDMSEQLTLDWGEVFKMIGVLAQEASKRKDSLERELARWVRRG